MSPGGTSSALRVRELGRKALRATGRTALGERVLRFYEREGLIAPTPPERQVAPVVAEHDERSQILQELWDRYLPHLPPPTYEDLSEALDDDTVPPLDRKHVDVASLTPDQKQWYEEGFVIKERFIPDEVLDAYWKVRGQIESTNGWDCHEPYMHEPEVLDLAVHRPLMDLLEELIGEPMGVMLNLTGIVSTERNWHQDDYLNYPGTKSWYAAVWVAVDDIDPASGPFQYVPRSHRWPALRRDRVKLFLDPAERESEGWPRLTERVLDRLIAGEIERRGGEIRTFVPKKGDVLVWHGRLMHRGSVPEVPGTRRMSFISHYTGLNHWAMGPNVGHHRDGGLYFLQSIHDGAA